MLPSAVVAVPTSPLRRSLTSWEWRLIALLLAACLLRSLPWRLDEYDQAKQAFTSLEMVKGGQWWFQHTPGCRMVATKPPLIGWISAAIYGLTGSWEWAWRLPSLLAAGALIFLLWKTGEKLLPGSGGTLAAGAFGFNLLTPRLSLLVRTDAPLCLWITVAGLVVARHAREDAPPWTQRDRWIVFTALLFANLTKGPIAYAFLLPGMVAWSVVTYRRGGRWQDVWGGWWHWALPVLPFLFWVERGLVTMPGFKEQVIVKEFLGRFTAGERAVHHTGPVWSYFAGLFTRWAPWSVLLLAVRFRANRIWWSLCRDRETLWLICWAAGGLVLMSLIPSKRIDRIYPVLPPLCLVLTALISRASRPTEDAEGNPAPRWPLNWSRLALTVAVGVSLVAGGKGVVDAYWKHENAYSRFGGQVRKMMEGRRVELVVGPKSAVGEEAMIIYLRQVRFLSPGEANGLARKGLLDGVVVHERSMDFARGLLGAFDPAQPRLVSDYDRGDEKPSRFLLLAQPAALPPRASPVSAPTPTPSPAHKQKPPSTRIP